MSNNDTEQTSKTASGNKAIGTNKSTLPPGAAASKKGRPGAGAQTKPARQPSTNAAASKKPAPGKKPSLPPGFTKKKRKETVETIKEESVGLRGELRRELQGQKPNFTESGRQILKFHGIYQQDDRDLRSKERHYQFMVRTRIPGGVLGPDQYLVHDDLADEYANGTLRITTRQGFQLHGVLKGDLASTLGSINHALLTTFSACGDIARNLMCSPAPASEPYHDEIQQVVDRLGDHLLPKTRAYHEIWLDGDKVYNGSSKQEDDPLYGATYLPRKFKVGIAYPGDNSIDVYTQDVGLIAVVENERLVGFNVLVGGGLGMTHNKPETYPRLGDLIGCASTDNVVDVVEKIVLIQRDHGDRKDRRHARLKYLIDDWGLDKFRTELTNRLGYELEPSADIPALELDLYLGWHRQSDKRWYLGLSVENGRIHGRLKEALRALVERYRPTLHLTPNHNVLLADVDESDRDGIDALLAKFGVPTHEQLTNARKYSMACPALPTCGLALAESERVMPELIDEFELELGRLGLQDEILGIRMTGCPNGCARPYVSEIGVVGRSLDSYKLYLGGSTTGTRLNRPFRDLVPLNEIVPTLRPVFLAFKEEREDGERFGDYCDRIGIEGLAQRSKKYEGYAEAH